MVTNTLWKWGVLKWDFFHLPPYFHMGRPHMETGTVFLPSIESCSAGASPIFLAENPIPSHLSLHLNSFSDILFFWQTDMPTVLFMYIHTHDFSMMRYSVRKQKVSLFDLLAPHFHKGIGNWDLTHPHMETVNHHFHVGNKKIRLPISTWGSPYGNGRLTHPRFHTGTVQSLTRFHMVSMTI